MHKAGKGCKIFSKAKVTCSVATSYKSLWEHDLATSIDSEEWSCPRLTGFWSRVFGLFQTLFHINAKLALLHCPFQGLFSYQQKLATYRFIAAKRSIARAWKKPSVLIAVVRSIMTNLMNNEKMSSILHDSHT